MEKSIGSDSAGNTIFDKILFEDFEKRLRIPRFLIEHLSEGSSQLAILKGPSGNFWHVKLDVTPHGIYLQDAWESFSRDHLLHKYDYLLFKYEGNMQFSVKIFDKFACKREDAFTVKPSQDSICEGRKRSSKPLTGLITKILGTTNKNYLDPDHLSQHLEKPATRCELPSSSKLQRYMVTPKIQVKEAAYSFTSYFPYFVTDMKASSVYKPFNLTIPVTFARLHFPSTSTMLELRNEKGNTWKVYCSASSDRYRLGGEFRSFVYDNHLKQGDHCVFELVDKLAMNVFIYRC